MKVQEILGNIKNDLSGILKTMLISERVNSQRCLNKDIDTTKTIIEHDNLKELSQSDINEIGSSLDKIIEEVKTMGKMMLISERTNSQRCINEDIDTTKTIIEHKKEKEFTYEEVKNLVNEAKKLIDTMLVSERINSQRCINKDIDTTKTIIEYNDKKEVKDNDSKIEKTLNELQCIVNEMLILERINSQRCVNKDIDTTKTILEQKNTDNEYSKK